MNSSLRLWFGLLLCVTVAILLPACGGGSNNGTSNQAFEMSGQWTIGSNGAGGGSNSMTANVVSSPCQVTTPVGTFSVYTDSSHTTLANTCFIADNNTGQGSISGTSGTWIYPPQGILIGVATDPVPANGSEPVGALYVEADSNGDYAVYDANGTVTASSKSMSGNFSCDSGTPVCSGQSGTFSATHQ